MKPFNVHALNAAAFLVGSTIMVLFAAERPFVQATMAIVASGFAFASVATFWWIEATYPEGEVFTRFKSALADYATFWATVSFFFAIIMTGKLPTG
jgi:hypothetical protein